MKKRRTPFGVYVENDFQNCPRCHGEAVGKHEAEIDDHRHDSLRRCRCYSCGCEWEENFEITGIYITKKGRKLAKRKSKRHDR